MIAQFALIHRYGVTMTIANVAEVLGISKAAITRLYAESAFPRPMHFSQEKGGIFATSKVGEWIDRSLEGISDADSRG